MTDDPFGEQPTHSGGWHTPLRYGHKEIIVFGKEHLRRYQA